ncbi:protocadherin-15-like isoform X7 [Octopus vulgaris]|uniref:Protocadherin-15-like isoform X7 n=1 Tax=Octopus vulgaris TaxID=6645 RepID=A0AA36BTK9_OCTVU|nr:protocadherin-15-like isoform X7 [Octopus vulgaris]
MATLKTTDIKLKIWFRMLLLWSVFKPAVFDSDCTSPSNILLEENVPKDTVIYEFGGGTWAIDRAEPPGYLDVAEVDSSYYLITKKVLDVEEMHNDIALSVYIKHKNEFPPRFTDPSYIIPVKENTPVGTEVFRASDFTTDKDFQHFLLYSMKQHNVNSSGGLKDKFMMNDTVNGTVYVAGHLDFELENQYFYDIKVEDGSFSHTAKLIIDVEDVDDLGPVFDQKNNSLSLEFSKTLPIYIYKIQYNYTGEITVSPEAVRAVDVEKEHYNVKYSLETATPLILVNYFAIDSETGQMRLEKELTRNISLPGVIIIKAEDVSSLAHSSIAVLFLLAQPNPILPPKLPYPPLMQPRKLIAATFTEGISQDVFIGMMTVLMLAVGSLVVALAYIIINCRKSRKEQQRKMEHYDFGGYKNEVR